MDLMGILRPYLQRIQDILMAQVIAIKCCHLIKNHPKCVHVSYSGPFPSGWLDNETGDIYIYDKGLHSWIPNCNIGCCWLPKTGRPSKIAGKVNVKHSSREDKRRPVLEMPLVAEDKQQQCYIRSKFVQHFAVKGFPAQSFLAAPVPDWCLNREGLPVGSGLNVIADGEKGPIILAQGFHVMVAMDISDDDTLQLVRKMVSNCIGHVLNRIGVEKGERIDRSLFETIFGYRGLGDGKYDSVRDVHPMTKPLAVRPVRSSIKEGPVYVDTPIFNMFFREHKDSVWDNSVLHSSRKHTTMGKKVKDVLRDPIMSRGKRISKLMDSYGYDDSAGIMKQAFEQEAAEDPYNLKEEITESIRAQFAGMFASANMNKKGMISSRRQFNPALLFAARVESAKTDGDDSGRGTSGAGGGSVASSRAETKESKHGSCFAEGSIQSFAHGSIRAPAEPSQQIPVVVFADPSASVQAATLPSFKRADAPPVVPHLQLPGVNSAIHSYRVSGRVNTAITGPSFGPCQLMKKKNEPLVRPESNTPTVLRTSTAPANSVDGVSRGLTAANPGECFLPRRHPGPKSKTLRYVHYNGSDSALPKPEPKNEFEIDDEYEQAMKDFELAKMPDYESPRPTKMFLEPPCVVRMNLKTSNFYPYATGVASKTDSGLRPESAVGRPSTDRPVNGRTRTVRSATAAAVGTKVASRPGTSGVSRSAPNTARC